MVNLYVRLVQKGLRTLDSVPAALREKVREMLEGDGMEEATHNLHVQHG